MQRALDLADRGAGQTRPNPVVGCVVVDPANNCIIGEGFHPRAGEPHAEVFALRDAGDQARGATAYVTLEPCNHTGRTPPCSQALIRAGVSRVVVGMVDPDPRTCGAGVETLRTAGIQVDVGVLNRKCLTANEGFTHRILKKRPFGTLKYAMTIDGKIATDSGSSRWVSGPDSREYVHRMRSSTDAIVVGGNTLRMDNPSLDVRLGVASSSSIIQPLRVVLTRSLQSLPLDAKVFDTASLETVIITDQEAARTEHARQLITSGVQVVGVEKAGPMAAANYLYERDALNVLWECGGNLASEAMKDGCIQRVTAFIAPKLVGGGPSAYTPMSDLGIGSMEEAVSLVDTRVEQFGEDMMVSGLVSYEDGNND